MADVRAAILGEAIAGITRVQHHRRLQLVLVVEVFGLTGVSGEMVECGWPMDGTNW